MSAEPQAVFKALLSSYVVPVLRQRGFRRAGQTFYILVEGNWGLISFQKSIYNTRECLTFTINIAVVSGRIRSFFDPDSSDSLPRYYEGQFQRRIGHLLPSGLDKWWEIDLGTSLVALGPEIQQCVVELAVPEVERHIGDGALRDLLLSGRGPVLTRYLDLCNLAVLLRALGPLDRLPPVLDEIQKITEEQTQLGPRTKTFLRQLTEYRSSL